MTFAELDFRIIYDKPHEAYKKAVDHAEEMSVHILGIKPVRILERVRPREDAAVRDYRLQSYEPITTAAADKAMFTVQKMMNPKLWNITFPEAGKDLEQYLFKDYPYYGSLMTYANDVIIRMMMADPNGVIAIIPINMEIPDTEQAQPIVTYISSSRILNFKLGEWYLIFDKEVVLKNGSGTKRRYLYYIDTQEIVYFYTEQAVDKQVTWGVEKSYRHSFGEAPVTHLGGIVTDMLNYGVIYRSYFSAALPNWNKAITADSDLDGAFINHMHPIRVELTEDCDYQFDGMRCLGGKVERDGVKFDCPSCFGTGRKSVKSPYGVYQVTKPQLGEQASPIAPVSYVTIPTEPTRMLQERVEAQLNKGLASLNMFFTVGENQSGIAKVLDRSELYDFLLTISTRLFDVILNDIIYYSAAYMYNNNVSGKLPSISKPVSFDLLSVNEVATELADAQKAGLSSSYIRAKMASLIQKDLFGKTIEQWFALDSLLLNPLSGMESAEVLDAAAAGYIDEEDAMIYYNIDKYLQELYAANPEFYKLPYEQKREAIVALAEVEEEELPESPDNA